MFEIMRFQPREDLLRTADSAYRQDDFPAALAIFEYLGQFGDPAANFYLGRMFATGRGVERCATSAARHYAWAASAGVSEAQNNLGRLYLRGEGVTRDPKTGARLLRDSALAGNTDAANTLTVLYAQGAEDFETDEVEAYAWSVLASELDDATAKRNRQGLECSLDPDALMAGRVYGLMLMTQLRSPSAAASEAPASGEPIELAATA